MAWQDKGGGQAPGSPWAAIMEAVREQLPSLDSDSSLSDFGDEEPFIFQRNQTALIPDLSEELAEDSAGVAKASASPEPVVVPVELASEPWGQCSVGARKLLEGREPGRSPGSCGGINYHLRVPEETLTWQEDDIRGTSFNTEGSQSPPWGPQGEDTHSPLEGDLKAESPSAASQAREGSDSANRRALRRERRKMIEKDILHKVTRDPRDLARSDPHAAAASGLRLEAPPEGPEEEPLLLSLQQFEEWDLDRLLQRLRGRGEGGDATSGATWWADVGFQGPGRTELSTQDRLLERLALLGASQSRAPAFTRKDPADPPLDNRPRGARSRCAVPAPGSPAGLGPGLAQGTRPRSSVEPATVFIDLRPPESSRLGSCESSSTSSSTSSDDEEEEEEMADLPEPASPSSQGLRHCTGKSQLLQQLRAFRMGTAQPQLPASKGPSGQNM